MEEAKGFQSSKSAAQQVSKILHEIIWLRFVDFKYHLPCPNPDQPSHGENFRLLEQIFFFFFYPHWGFQELDGKLSPTPVILASHTANKEEKVPPFYPNFPLEC